MKKLKICPIITSGKPYEAYCVEDGCAFWNEEDGECIFQTILKFARTSRRISVGGLKYE